MIGGTGSMQESEQYTTIVLDESESMYAISALIEVKIQIIDQFEPSVQQLEMFTSMASVIWSNNSKEI
jgi:hypothetical protein